MANVKLNALVDGVSGKVGKNIVLRQRGGRTLLGTKPEASLIVSDKQKAQRQQFAQASRFAKGILLNDEAKKEYAELAKTDEFLTPYSAAVADFLNNPEITLVDITGYTGKAGDKIIARTGDDFKIISMKVSLQQADGSVIESGDAVSNGASRLEWGYTAIQNVAALTGLKVVITAQDRPGHIATSEKVVS
jgi:hypothetical protein